MFLYVNKIVKQFWHQPDYSLLLLYLQKFRYVFHAWQIMIRHIRINFLIFFLTLSAIHSSYALINPPDGKLFPPGDARRNIYHIGLNIGFTNYFGDLVNNNLKTPFYYRYGIQVNAERDIFKATRLCVNFFGGNILGDEKTATRNLNFKSSVVAPQLGLSFNFLHWANRGKLHDRFAMYLFAGVEALFFTATGDLKNSTGETYYYWDDGSIRNIPETYSDQDNSSVIKRDNKFETNYRNLDIDNVGKVPQFTFGIPLGLSAEVKFNNGIAIRAGAVFHYTFSDYLDNITANSLGSRKGNSATDKFLFTYAGVYYTLPMYSRKSVCGTQKMNTSRINKKKPKIKFK
jgi:hypothetical protein